MVVCTEGVSQREEAGLNFFLLRAPVTFKWRLYTRLPLKHLCAAINIDSQGAMCVCAYERVIRALKEETVTVLLPIFTLDTQTVLCSQGD